MKMNVVFVQSKRRCVELTKGWFGGALQFHHGHQKWKYLNGLENVFRKVIQKREIFGQADQKGWPTPHTARLKF